MPEKKNTARQQAKPKAVIYMGPTIPGVVKTGRTFSNGLPPQMKDAVKELPALNILLVDVADIVRARKELKSKNSAMSTCYKKALEYAKKKGEKG